MERQGLQIFMTDRMTEMEEFLTDKDVSLFLSDQAETVDFLKSRNCGTIAWYHEGVKGTFWNAEIAVQNLEDISLDFLIKVYQRYRKIPWHIAETERLEIREMSENDLDSLYAIYQSEDVTRFTEGLYEDRETELQYIRGYIKNIYAYYGYGVWLLIEKKTGRLVGRAGISHRPGYEEAELGFLLGKEFWHQGFAFEACQKIIQIAKEVFEMNSLQALVKKENLASIKLLGKLGFYYAEEVMLEGESYQRFLRKMVMD